MATVVEFIADEQLQIGLVTAQDSKRLTVSDPRGRAHRIAPEKVLFRHSASSAEDLLRHIESLGAEIDLELLWETLHDENKSEARDAADYARLFFDRSDALHASAMYRTLVADALYFRRRGKQFSPRTRKELDEVRRMREAEQQAVDELRALKQALDARPIDAGLAQRVESRLRGQADKLLDTALGELASNPAEHAFTLLVDGGHLPPTTDFDVLAANLVAEHPVAVIEHAQGIAVSRGSRPLSHSAFSIDDPDTREVDDAITVTREGDLVRVDVDIADAGAFVSRGDPLDREARRRGATVYLPTRRYYMLPEQVGCDRASLLAGVERPVMRTSLWLDEQANVERFEMRHVWTIVQRRLDYETADGLIASGTDETSEALRLLQRLAEALRQRRRSAGALLIQRPEWKLRVEDAGKTISVSPIDPSSPSRRLVGELMILANAKAARTAHDASIPLIYRAQAAPKQALPELDPADPVALLKLRGLISPASLSLEPQPHFGLGLQAYAQVSSPLRRYADLVQQRQLVAYVRGETPPYSTAELLEVLAAVEGNDQAMRRVENAVTQRWTLEYVARLPSRRGLTARVMGEVGGGAKAMLLGSGAEGLLALRSAAPPLGTELAVDIDRVNPRRGSLRMVPSRS